MIALHHVSGLVLAGGQGRRMQQRGQEPVEKGLMLLHDKPLVSWAASAMPAEVSQLYISANRYPVDYAPYGVVVADAPDLGDDLGPLAGVASVMREMPTQWLYTAPADVPFPPKAVVQKLLHHVNTQGGDLVYACTEQPQPLFMLVNKNLLNSLEHYLHSGLRRVQLWQREHGHAVHFDADDDAFFNINTPDDLRLAHQRLPTSR